MAKLPKRFEDSVTAGMPKHEAAKALRQIKKVFKDMEGTLSQDSVTAILNSKLDKRSGQDAFKV